MRWPTASANEDRLTMTTVHTDGGRHWQEVDRVRAWVARMSRPEYDRTEQFRLLVCLLPFATSDSLRILDLGAGPGALSAAMFDAFPMATGVGADFSDAMMTVGRENMRRFGDRFRYVRWDLNDDHWPAELNGPWNLIVSSLAIHHLTDERKIQLYRQVFHQLTPGGWFVNVDQVCAPDAAADETNGRAFRALMPPHEDHTHSRERSETLAPLNEQLTWL